MSLNLLFTLNAIVGIIFSLGFLLMPEQVVALYGAALDPVGVIIARLFGALLLGFAAVIWFARKAEESEARLAILRGGFVAWVVGLVTALISQLSGVMNSLGWLNVVIYLLFSLGFGYFLFMKKP